MSKNLIYFLADSQFAQRVARIRLPVRKFPLKVKGSKMYAHTLDRYLALWLWKLGMLESFEARLVETYCQPGSNIVDVGANIGFYTLLFSRIVGEVGNVWAFEPAPNNVEVLRRNVVANGCTNITIVEAGVSKTNEDGSLFISKSHQGDHRIYPQKERDSFPIKLFALDEYFPATQRIDLIKMDIQGAEGYALKGMNRILASNPGLIVIMEFWPDMLSQLGFSPSEILQTFLDLGYRLQIIDEKNQKLSELSNHQELIYSLSGSKSHANLFCTAPL